ncbi:MAG: OmpH family outer membrane protein [Elusimicrobia bacterium]|nr:OmpH family outer membrane protein [Elusimicrobiota bacterium]
MKKFIAAIILSVILTSASLVLAAGLKIGYVDVASIFDQYSETKRAKLALEKEIKAKQDTIQKMSDEIKNLRVELEAQQSALSADDKKNKTQEIDRKAQDLQKFTEDSETELSKKEADLTQNILAKIYAAVQQAGQDKGFSLVLDKNNVIFGLDSWNITADILKALESGPAPLSSPTSGYILAPNQSPAPTKAEENSPNRLNIKEE